jgi:hypothetical protein
MRPNELVVAMHEEEFVMTEAKWKAMAAFHRRRSFADEVTPEKRAYHRRAAKIISARLKKNETPRSTGRNCARHIKKGKMSEKYNSHCVVCKNPCRAPRSNFHANSVSLCKKAKCRRIRKTQLQKERRRQVEMKFVKKISKHNSHAKASRTNRIARQNWKSGVTLAPKQASSI